MSFPSISRESFDGIESGGAVRAYNTSDGTKIASNNKDEDLFKARERNVNLSGVSAFCHPNVNS